MESCSVIDRIDEEICKKRPSNTDWNLRAMNGHDAFHVGVPCVRENVIWEFLGIAVCLFEPVLAELLALHSRLDGKNIYSIQCKKCHSI